MPGKSGLPGYTLATASTPDPRAQRDRCAHPRLWLAGALIESEDQAADRRELLEASRVSGSSHAVGRREGGLQLGHRVPIKLGDQVVRRTAHRHDVAAERVPAKPRQPTDQRNMDLPVVPIESLRVGRLLIHGQEPGCHRSARWYRARTAAPACSADRHSRYVGMPPAGKSRSPAPRIVGKVRSRYSSITSAAISVRTTLRLPVTITSRDSRLTASTRSPSMTCEFAQADTSCGVRETTRFGTAFSRSENGSVRSGQSRENNCHVVRPSSMTPLSSVLPSWNLSPATVSGPCLNAQPPAGVPPRPSGSETIPSRVMN